MSDTGAPGPGWHYAEGDPPGTQRYWDGTQWQGGPQPVAPTPGFSAAPAAPGYMSAPGMGVYPESSQATTSLVLAILGLLCCGPLAAGGWYLGAQEVTAIDAGKRDPMNRGTANAGKIVGIIGTLIWGLFILGYILLAFAAVA